MRLTHADFAKDPVTLAQKLIGCSLCRRFDDGENQDDVAADGRYSAGIVVDASFDPGTYALEVVAIDRAGAERAPAPYTFTVR